MSKATVQIVPGCVSALNEPWTRVSQRACPAFLLSFTQQRARTLTARAADSQSESTGASRGGALIHTHTNADVD